MLDLPRRLASISLLGCALIASACGDSGGNQPPPPPPPGMIDSGMPSGDAGMTPDGSAADGSIPDAGPPDAPPADADPYEAFIEEFMDSSNVDEAMSTARIDPAGSGSVDGSFLLLSPGSGGGPIPAELTLAPGEHQFEYGIIREPITIAGDAVIRVQDDLSIESTGGLTVEGSLDLAIGGYADIRAPIEVRGRLRIHLNGTSPFTLSSTGRLSVASAPTGNGGDVEIYSRGPISIEGAVAAGDAMTFPGRGGHLTIRTYRDISVSGDMGTLRVGGGPGGNGEAGLFTERSILIENAPGALEVTPTGDVSAGRARLHAKEGISIASSLLWGTAPFGLELITEREVSLFSTTINAGAGEGTHDILIRAAGIAIGGSSVITAPVSSDTLGGSIYLESTRSVDVNAMSLLRAGEGRCANGGAVIVEAANSIRLSGTPTLLGGDSQSDPGCMRGAGGSVSLTSATTIVIDGDRAERLVPGMGTPAGEVTVSEIAAVTPTTPVPELSRSSTLISVPIGLRLPRVQLTRFEPAWIAPAGTEGQVYLSADGTAEGFAPAETLVFGELQNGFRFRVDLEARFFDSMKLDRIELYFGPTS